jgi:hypothetical protein
MNQIRNWMLLALALVVIHLPGVARPQDASGNPEADAAAVPAEALTDWTGAGLLAGTPKKARFIFDLTAETGGTWDEKLASALAKARKAKGLPVIRFPAGTYGFEKGIVLSQESAGNGVVFQGAGADSTFLEFRIGRDGNCFEVRGAETGVQAALEADMPKRTRRIEASGLSDHFRTGDWVRLCESGFPDADPENVGEVTRIRETSGGGGSLETESNKAYAAGHGLWIRKIDPVRNVGFEGFTLRRLDAEPSSQSAYNSGDNFLFDVSVNCWIRGVASRNTCRHHVCVNRSGHLLIEGSSFADAVSRDENSYGYGILLEVCTSRCLIQNNAFDRLRHAMAVCEGVNGNVFAFNYSRGQAWTYHGLPNLFQGADLCLHGRYPYANLFEHNVVEFVYADNSHGPNGPYNAFLRNWVYHGFNGKGLLRLYRAPQSIVLGNISTTAKSARVRYDSCKPFRDAFGRDRKRRPRSHGDSHDAGWDPAETGLETVSYFYRYRPDFLPVEYTWPAIGPDAGNGPPVQRIPAMRWFEAGRAADWTVRTEWERR